MHAMSDGRMVFDVTNHYADDLDFRYSPEKPESPYGPPPEYLICTPCAERIWEQGARPLGKLRATAAFHGCGEPCEAAWCQCKDRNDV